MKNMITSPRYSYFESLCISVASSVVAQNPSWHSLIVALLVISFCSLVVNATKEFWK